MTSYVAVGQAVLWNELAWVIAHDDLYVKSRELGLALKWQPVNMDDSEVVPGNIYMRNEQIITPRVVGAVLEMA